MIRMPCPWSLGMPLFLAAGWLAVGCEESPAPPTPRRSQNVPLSATRAPPVALAPATSIGSGVGTAVVAGPGRDDAAPCTSRRACMDAAAASSRRKVASAACVDECTKHGRCQFEGTQCVARSTEDCVGSAVCLLQGACTLVVGRCDEGERTCRQCRVGDGLGCRDSLACRDLGQCTLAPPLAASSWGACVVGDDADCRQSRSCRRHGECVAKHGACVAASLRDCQRSRACAEERRCRYVGESCISES